MDPHHLLLDQLQLPTSRRFQREGIPGEGEDLGKSIQVLVSGLAQSLLVFEVDFFIGQLRMSTLRKSKEVVLDILLQ